jgi:predicted phosphoribosyltransferase
MVDRFRDRADAGRMLAEALAGYAGRSDVIVLALPRGGVPVGFEVARALGAPLDVCVVRKLGVPGQEELAMGAIASGGVVTLNEDVLDAAKVSEDDIAAVTAREAAELTRREREYRGNRPPPEVARHIVILVDDGLATGATMRAAAAAIRRARPARLVVAVPTASEGTCAELRHEVDEVVCPYTPYPFQAVGRWYEDFTPTTDEEVRQLLAAAARS